MIAFLLCNCTAQESLFKHLFVPSASHRCGPRLRRPVKQPRWGAQHPRRACPPVLCQMWKPSTSPSHLLQVWKQSPFRQRRLLLKTLLKYIIQNQDTICRCGAHSEHQQRRGCQSVGDDRARPYSV